MHWRLQRLSERVRTWAEKAHYTMAPEHYKGSHEAKFWRERLAMEVTLRNDHYEFFYTTFFGLDKSFYRDKSILDVGCGPRGSLEWANMASERVGVDPLAKTYLQMGAASHKMKYVAAPSENMPFSDAYFDVVCSFNSLDHVADEKRTAREMNRVLKPGGLLLVIVEVNHEPTPEEPITLNWQSAAELFGSTCNILETSHFEIGDHDIYNQLRRGSKYDDADPSVRPGVLVAKMTKRLDF